MFKKTITLLTSTGLALALSVAHATPQELSSVEMDSVNAGWSWYNYNNQALANAFSTAYGNTTTSGTFTNTITKPGFSSSQSGSSASSAGRYMVCSYCGNY